MGLQRALLRGRALYCVLERRKVGEQPLHGPERLGDEPRRLVKPERGEQIGELEEAEQLRPRLAEQVGWVERAGEGAADIPDRAEPPREPRYLLRWVDEAARAVRAAEAHLRQRRGRQDRRIRHGRRVDHPQESSAALAPPPASAAKPLAANGGGSWRGMSELPGSTVDSWRGRSRRRAAAAATSARPPRLRDPRASRRAAAF